MARSMTKHSHHRRFARIRSYVPFAELLLLRVQFLYLYITFSRSNIEANIAHIFFECHHNWHLVYYHPKSIRILDDYLIFAAKAQVRPRAAVVSALGERLFAALF